MTSPLNVIRFPGIHPDTLGHYLSGLGLLATVGLKWPDVRGCWRDRRFVLLHESLTVEQVRQHLLAEWQPTNYERWWAVAQSSKDDAKLRALRKGRSVAEVRVMEAHLVGTKVNGFNPVFGNAGTLGQRAFESVWEKCRKLAKPDVRTRQQATAPAPSRTAKPPKQPQAQIKSETWLEASLSATEGVDFPTVKAAGTWFVFANKSFNTGQDWFREGRLSPWSYLLAIEGAFLLVGDVNRRLGAKARPYAAFPFVCDPAQPTAAGEVGMSKGEFWAPLWDHPATLAEVQHLLRRGLARVGSRAAHAPAEFAVAALGAGTDAGVGEFARFELRQTTSAKVYEAVPREHIAVARPEEAGGAERLAAAELLSQLIRWLGQLPYEPHKSDQRGKFCGFRGPVEAAIVRVSEGIGRHEEPDRWRELLLKLAHLQSRIDRNKVFRESLPPVPRLRPGWFDRAWPAGWLTDEIVVARSVASIGDDPTSPILVNVFGVQAKRGGRFAFAPGERPARAVWDDGETTGVLGRLLRRRLIDAEADKPLPVGGTCPAPLHAISRFLCDDLDMEKVATWVPTLSLIDWSAVHVLPVRYEERYAGELLLWGLFKPIFHAHDEEPHHEDPLQEDPYHQLFTWLRDKPRSAQARRILHLILAGNIDEAIRAAKSYYRSGGQRVVDVPTTVPSERDFHRRLAAALLIPAADRDIQSGLKRWLFPVKRTTE